MSFTHQTLGSLKKRLLESNHSFIQLTLIPKSLTSIYIAASFVKYYIIYPSRVRLVASSSLSYRLLEIKAVVFYYHSLVVFIKSIRDI